jgi:hypothetical protein
MTFTANDWVLNNMSYHNASKCCAIAIIAPPEERFSLIPGSEIPNGLPCTCIAFYGNCVACKTRQMLEQDIASM